MTETQSIKSIKIDATEYAEFIKENRLIINKYLNNVLWFCVFTGPAIAVGIWFGVFNSVTYRTCFIISVSMILVALAHRFIIDRFPYSQNAGFIAFFVMELLLIRMAYSHIHIHITWFFVPLLSILFCEKRVFILASLTNFISMTISTYLISPYNASINSYYDTPHSFFVNAMMGYAIESFIMFDAGMALIMVLQGHFANLITKNSETREASERLKSQMDILYSMAEVYDNVNLIDFKSMTEMSLRERHRTKPIELGDHAHSFMNHKIKREVAPEQFEDFQAFTNLKTLKDRLKNKHFLFAEFINVNKGWFRAQYIKVEADETGLPTMVVYTVQNINMHKRREEDLIRISHTDELTQLFNRRSLDDDLSIYKDNPIEDDFVIASVDINRLKYVNDTYGHAAGDELICAAADCLAASVGSQGKVYRTGGDEFTAIIHTTDIPSIEKRIHYLCSNWKGSYTDDLALSKGYASHKDYPDATIDQLKKIADDLMYDSKNAYYKEHGFERRHI